VKQQKSISLYWSCQLIGWSLAGLFWGFSAWMQMFTGGHSGQYSYTLALFHFGFDLGIGILITHAYYRFAHNFNFTRLKLQNMPVRLIPAVLLMGICYMLLVTVKLYVARYYFTFAYSESFGMFFRQNYLVLLATGIRLMAIWVLAFHLYHYALMEIGTATDNARLQVVARDAQMQQLSAQLNPHFFFNSLNSVKALTATNPVKARRAIDLLSDLLRATLYGSNAKLISLRDEVNLVNDYLELEKIRFEERLQFTVDMEEGTEHCLIPPLSIQTLVENAIKHGIAHQKAGGEIKITIKNTDGKIRIAVLNPGRLTAAGNQHGLGLKNLKDRLLLQYQNQASFVIEEVYGDKVLSTIVLPAL
jgi:sensor histidine kinase YesM